MIREEHTLENAMAILKYIAEQADCPACNFDKTTMVEGVSICSKHRSPIIVANGFLHGWTRAGGRPVNFNEVDE